MEYFDFSEALKRLKNGKKVWRDNKNIIHDYYLKKTDGPVDGNMYKKNVQSSRSYFMNASSIFRYCKISDTFYFWEPTQDDLFAIDWYEVE